MAAPAQPAWPKCIAWARALVSGWTLVALYIFVREQPWPLVCGIGLYLAYALFLAIRGAAPGGMLGLFALFLDTVVFLALANFEGGRLQGAIAAGFLFLLAEAMSLYGPIEVIIVSATLAVFFAIAPNPALRMGEPAAIVGGALGWVFTIQKRRHAAELEALRRAAEEARASAGGAREEERLRIASDFHDGPLQSFISMQMRLEILRKLLERDFEAGVEDLKQLQGLAQTQVRDLRAFLNSMRPLAVEGANLVAAARRTAEAFQKESGIPVAFLGTNTPVGLPQETTTEVLQMLREALHNAQKHAEASRVAVAVEKTDGALQISVDDNGRGFNFSGSYTLEELELLRLGPASLKRRARTLNAEMTLESHPGRGVGLKFRVPLP